LSLFYFFFLDIRLLTLAICSVRLEHPEEVIMFFGHRDFDGGRRNRPGRFVQDELRAPFTLLFPLAGRLVDYYPV
jgi:hypothetical protein